MSMTDLEITRLCAEAMGWRLEPYPHGLRCRNDEGDCVFWITDAPAPSSVHRYDPLHDDAQAMALVKKLSLFIECRFFLEDEEIQYWNVFQRGYGSSQMRNTDLNRAICECVAKMQKAKVAA